ncbi:MAG TPA: c-type cytochrome [Telluria sp.]|nr:c-type cytochrome [Telluria sp.]
MKHVLALLITGAALSGHAQAAGNAVQGQKLYQAMCAACHSMEYNGVGPAHKGVFGRKAGSQAGYSYSPALKASKVVWGEKDLDRWLTNPEKFIPGQKMGFLVASASDRADLVAYLKMAAKP